MKSTIQASGKIEDINIFIISWKGQHESAAVIADELYKSFKNVTIVYSDPDPDFSFTGGYSATVRPNNLFWADKFSTCINQCNTDVMLVIHADCSCENWTGLAQKMRSTLIEWPDIWVLAPLIDGASYELEATRIGLLGSAGLEIVAETDGIIFALRRPVVERMKRADYSKNLYGWGISAMFCAFALQSQKLIVVDKLIKAIHPPTRGYDSTNSWSMRTEFLKQLNRHEKILAFLLRFYVSHRQKRKV